MRHSVNFNLNLKKNTHQKRAAIAWCCAFVCLINSIKITIECDMLSCKYYYSLMDSKMRIFVCPLQRKSMLCKQCHFIWMCSICIRLQQKPSAIISRDWSFFSSLSLYRWHSNLFVIHKNICTFFLSLIRMNERRCYVFVWCEKNSILTQIICQHKIV